MPGGILQLLTAGTETEYLNNVPHISFFKCYFRRHTNFFINNVEIFSNYYENSNVNTFLIPKSGDLLSKSYLKFNFDENYIEILQNYETVVSTLTYDITTFFDSYNILINQFNKNDITDIQNIKFIISFNNVNYLSLMSTYIINNLSLIYAIKFNKDVVLQLNESKIMYNINQPYSFYGFNYYVNYSSLYNTIDEKYNILNLLTNAIDYQNLRYFRLDLLNLNMAFKFTFENVYKYQNLFNLCIKNIDMTCSNNKIKINQYDIYISLNFNLNNYSSIQNLIDIVDFIKKSFNDYSNAKARYYTNKIKYNDVIIKQNEMMSFINNMFGKKYASIYNNFLNGNANIDNNIQSKQSTYIIESSYFFYNIIFPELENVNVKIDYPISYISSKTIEMDIFNLRDNIFLGNLDTNDFDGSLINNETNIINQSNISNSKSLSLDLYNKILVNLFCIKSHDNTIQNFLSIVNSQIKIINHFYTNYNDNIDKFNNIILDAIIHNNILFLNSSSIKSIIFQNTSFNYNYSMATQFIKKQIANYENSIINNYIFNNIFKNINSNNYCFFNMKNLLIQTIILSNYVNLNFVDIPSINFFYAQLLNYNNNNNVFEYTMYNYFPGYDSNDTKNLFNLLNDIYTNLENFLYYTIYLIKVIINSNKTIYTIYNKNSNAIYDVNGLTKQSISKNTLNDIIFPLTSSFLFFTNNLIDNLNYENSYNMYYNINKTKYLQNIKKAMYQIYSQQFENYNFNLNNKIKNFDEICDFFNNLYVDEVISNYYDKNKNYLMTPNYNNINDFIKTINNNNSFLIYNSSDIDYKILFSLFKIADTTLFNNSFSNYEISYPQTNTFYFTNNVNNNYLKFIFLPNSPYYRLYYLYNFLASMTNDVKLLSEMPKDLIILRDFTLLILISLINFYNNLTINIPSKYNSYNFNTDIFFTFNVFLNNHFMCYDNINILFNQQIKEIFNNTGMSKNLFIYAPFYFLINNVLISKNNDASQSNNGFNTTYLLSNLYNSIKMNFDDYVTYVFLISIIFNKQYFINVDDTIDFVKLFLNKNDLKFDICINALKKIIVSKNQYNNDNNIYNFEQFQINQFYNNCYYTAFSIGVMFDNVNKLIIKTINDLYAIPNKLIDINMFSLFYSNTTFDIKQYQNILSSNQLSNGFEYFKKLLFDIDINLGTSALIFYENFSNGIFKYIYDNFSYIINYVISDYVFDHILAIFNNSMSLYNSKNNTNINLYYFLDNIYNLKFNDNNFQTKNIIIIYLLYYTFVFVCMRNDIKKYIDKYSSYSEQTFNRYVISMYSQNIYLKTLEEIITLINGSTEKIIFNYSTIYIQNIANEQNLNDSIFYSQESYIHNIIFNNTINFNNSNLFENIINDFDATNIDPNKINSNIFNNQYNIEDIVSWNQFNTKYFNPTQIDYYNTNSVKQLSYNTQFYYRYFNSIDSILNQNEKLLFISNNKYFLNYISSNKLVGKELSIIYNDYINTIYNQNIKLINNIYNNLNISFQSNNLSIFTEYQNILINQLFAILSKFYNDYNDKKTYTYTLMFSNTLQSKMANNLNNVLPINIFDITTFNNTVEKNGFIRDFTINYINSRITSSFNIEKNINRYIYIYINNFILKKNNYDNSLTEYMNTHTLYEYVKMYNNIYSKSNNIIYEKNLALYQNDIIFEILNYENYTDDWCFLQNPIFNDFIVNFSMNPIDNNSFYENFKRFVDFFKEYNQSNLFNKMNLSNHINVIDYFLDLFNIDELHTYIYEFINLNESFSPISIYENIIFIKNQYNNNLSSKLIIDFDNIMKKIIIYLFMLYLINANLFNLINNTIDIKVNNNYTIEYNFPFAKIDVNLDNVFDSNFYDKLKRYIYKITVFDKNYPSIYKSVNNNINEFDNIAFFYDIQKNTNVNDFFNLCAKYTSSYELTIGFNDINTNSVVIQEYTNDFTFSSLVQSINVILNLDQSINNTSKYFLTNATIVILKSFYNTSIYDINNINIDYDTSNFNVNINKYYNKSSLKNANLLFILLIKLLNKYNISYSNQTDDINNTIANFWIGTFNINEILEELKGYTSYDYIKNDTINFSKTKNTNNLDEYLNSITIPYIFSRSQNMSDLSELTNKTQNYSNIIPIDYDYDIINFNMKNIYNNGINIYKKYYNYQYNFYQFEDNYKDIYNKKYEYYTNIINNDYALLNISKFNKDFFNKVFTNIIYTWFSQPYIKNQGNNMIFEQNFNQLIKLYMKYYFSFKLNNNLSDVDNLKLQNTLKNVPQNMSLTEIGMYIKQLYYYELFGLPYISYTYNNTVTDDFTYFMKIIESDGNYNIKFINIVNNFAFNLENSIILINWYLKKNFLINNDTKFIKEYINYFVNEFSSYENISSYFNNSNLYYQQINNPYLYSQIVNTINYDDFIERFSKSVKQIIYYTDNISIVKNLQNIYATYFENITFYYRKYVDNDYITIPYTFTITEFQQYIYQYIIYVIQNTISNKSDDALYSIIYNIIKNTFNKINTNKITQVYNWVFNKNITEYNNDIHDKFTFDLYNLLINNYWGLIFSEYTSIIQNDDFNFKILLSNYGMIKLYNPLITVDYVHQINYKLNILFKLEIFYIYINNFSDSIFQQYLFYTLINCNQFYFNNSLFYCINLENDVSNYLDFINHNMINNNLIANYYKTIQNKTIFKINYYGINNFYNYNVNNSVLSNIYDEITNKFIKTNETSIINIFIQNTIINILNQFNLITYDYSALKSNIQYIDNVFDIIIQKISSGLDIFKVVFGGINKKNTGMRISITQLVNIFSNVNYNYDNNIINIFTLIYDNFNNLGIEQINYNMLIILFYYICMIIYILNKWDNIYNQYLFNNHKNVIYELINYINIQIYNYNNSLETAKTNDFFNGLNKLFFDVQDNQTFTQNIITFFDSIVQINKIFYKEKLQQLNIKTKMKFYSGNTLDISNDYLTNLLYKKYVSFNKILIWQNMLVNIVDANLSNPIYFMKSLMYDTLFDIPTSFVNTIAKITNGLFSQNGIINLIKKMELYISDELIDTINNTMLVIIKDLMTNLNVLTALNQMLGIEYTTDFIKQGPIKPYILKSYKNTSLYVPIKFFFKDIMNAIPLISCMYSDILIKIFNTNKNLFKEFYTTTYLLPPNKKINTSILADFILLERTERKRLTLNKQDNLIEKHNYYTVSQIINNQYFTKDEFLYVNFDFNINGLIKEIFWTVNFFVNGYLIENNNYNSTSIFDMILSTVFYIDGVRRDGFYPVSTKNVVPDINTTNYINNSNNQNNPGDNIIISKTTYNYNNITRLLNPYRYNTRIDNSNNNFNTYSFSFQPEKFQPTGAINMDTYNTFRIQLVIDKQKFFKYFGDIMNVTNLNNVMITIDLTTLEYNLIRYQSGLAGLLFMK